MRLSQADSTQISFAPPQAQKPLLPTQQEGDTQSVRFQIQGMRCTSCAATIEHALRQLSGVKEANIYILTHSGVVRFSPKECNIQSLIERIQSLGFQATIDSKPQFFAAPKTSFLQPKQESMNQNALNQAKPNIIQSNIIQSSQYANTQFSPTPNPHNTTQQDKMTISCDSQNPNALPQDSNQDTNKNAQHATSSQLPTQSDIIDESIPPSIHQSSTNAPHTSPTKNNESLLINQNTQNSTTKADHIHQSMRPNPIFTTLKRVNDYIEYRLLNDTRRLILSVICTLIVLYISMIYDMFGMPLPKILQDSSTNALLQLFLTLCVMHFGRNLYFHGIRALWALRPNMDSLVSVGSLAGFLYSVYAMLMSMNGVDGFHIYFEGVCVILTFILFGKYVEECAKQKAMQYAKNLLERQNEYALKIVNPLRMHTEGLQTQSISCANLAIGDYIQILPHSFIPIDCVLLDCVPHGQYASIDESLLSGESLPVSKQEGSQLYAGTLNLETPLIARVSHSLQDSTLNAMHTLLQQTLESKAQIARIADRISLIFVPLVFVFALCSGAFWFFYADMQTAISFFASTLLISCPCALGLAVPMAILFANARANASGIFFKDAKHLESLTTIDYILFDKTGTLTQKELGIQGIYPLDSQISKEELLRIAASIEATSSHLIAKAICKAHTTPNLYKQIRSTQCHNAGLESILQINDEARTFLLGNAKLLQERANIGGINESEAAIYIHIAELRESGAVLLGSILLSEQLKPHTKETITRLQNMGYQCAILSGDNTKSVAHIANILQIPFTAQCLPEDKMRHIESLQNSGHKVLMVGDGMNDSIAIAKANLSLVMASGSAVSIEHGSILYFRDDLLGIVEALRLGRATLRNIKQNFCFAFIYNVICIPIAMGVCAPLGIVLSPMVASIAMSMSSLSVVGNASRLYWFR